MITISREREGEKTKT